MKAGEVIGLLISAMETQNEIIANIISNPVIYKDGLGKQLERVEDILNIIKEKGIDNIQEKTNV